ncbi:class I SAM-dependent methyltransferase [Microscilla marina]|uniref:Methyltransferase type 12 domain-containing protein n=1 Tax=Microscilla marina ATCC 23134 TaxID=313606 RepID=A1ZXS0_MICM2|nr:class I SAM-dependent methyltransferase [Microscilla marina]EAY24848.1 hypothetical protein M23134_06740 [Microscilla marina ATCC 23134]
METIDTIKLLGQVPNQAPQVWADIGAGTGVFTVALQMLLAPQSTVWAVDKNPHVLWSLPKQNEVNISVEEGNFERAMDLPLFDGIVMANALHYATDPAVVLQNVLQHLKPSGTFILIEYDTSIPNPPWVPYPVSLAHFQKLASQLGLNSPKELHRVSSQYGQNSIYSVSCQSLQKS